MFHGVDDGGESLLPEALESLTPSLTSAIIQCGTEDPPVQTCIKWQSPTLSDRIRNRPWRELDNAPNP